MKAASTPNAYPTSVIASFFAVLLLAGCAAMRGGPEMWAGRFEFGLIGDQQYSAELETKFPHLIENINSANLTFVVHDGDFRGGQPCSDEFFYKRREEFQTSRHPFIYVPGDNDWAECRDQEKGGLHPLERLTKLRETFFQGDRSLGQRALRLSRQSENPQYSKFAENVRWDYEGVMFLTLHIIGNNDNLGKSQETDVEYAGRNAANLAWLKEAFDLARKNGSRAIMLIIQANPRFEDTWPPSGRRGHFRRRRGTPTDKKSGYADFLKALETETVAFGKPVVLVHGDTHYFRIDKPMVSSISGRFVENFTRVETFGHPDAHWIRVLVDPEDPNVFSFKPEIVKKNLLDHRAK